MNLSTLHICQRNLRRKEQIPAMVRDILADKELPPITLCFDESIDAFVIHNGHHRAFAYLQAGLTELPEYAYVVEHGEARASFGEIRSWLDRT